MSDMSQTRNLFGFDYAHEQVVLFHDESSGLRGAIAIHSTVLGPAMGGLRVARYDSFHDLVEDALRLSRTMTLKNSAAGLDLGGGKAVLWDDGLWHSRRTARLRAFAGVLERLNGRYITAEDVGTTPADMALIAEDVPWVAGRPTELGGAGDPSPATAQSVFASLRAGVLVALRAPNLSGLTVGVFGLGAVGMRLAEMLHAADAELAVADLDERRTADAAARLGAIVMAPADLLAAEVDVFAPCALGGVIRPDNVARLRCRVIAGAANNPLSGDDVALTLHRQRVLYVPDFLANCGGIIHVASEIFGYTQREVDVRINRAVKQTAGVLHDARQHDQVPLDLAFAFADRRLSVRMEEAA